MIKRPIGEAYEDFLRFERSWGYWNEYIYFNQKEQEPIYAELTAWVFGKQYSLCQNLAQAWLDDQSRGWWWITEQRHYRVYEPQASRSEELTTIPLERRWPSLNDPQIRFKTLLYYRMPYPSPGQDSQYTSKQWFWKYLWGGHTRPNNQTFLGKSWKSPTPNSLNQRSLVDVKGLTVIRVTWIRNPWRRYIAVTLLRASGELGDWGYFPTPEACLRNFRGWICGRNAIKLRGASPLIAERSFCRHRWPRWKTRESGSVW